MTGRTATKWRGIIARMKVGASVEVPSREMGEELQRMARALGMTLSVRIPRFSRKPNEYIVTRVT